MTRVHNKAKMPGKASTVTNFTIVDYDVGLGGGISSAPGIIFQSCLKSNNNDNKYGAKNHDLVSKDSFITSRTSFFNARVAFENNNSSRKNFPSELR